MRTTWGTCRGVRLCRWPGQLVARQPATRAGQDRRPPGQARAVRFGCGWQRLSRRGGFFEAVLRRIQACRRRPDRWSRSRADCYGAPGSGPRKWVDLLLVLGVTVILCLPRVGACHDLGEQAYPYRTHYCYADLDCTTGVNDPDVCEFDDCEMSFCHGYYSFCVHHAYWGMFPTCWGTIYCS